MINLKTKNWKIENIETVLFDKDGTFIDLHFFWGKMTELRCEEIIKIFNLNSNCFEALCLCLGYDSKTGKMLKDGITALYSRSKIIEIFQKDLEKFNVQTTKEKLTEIFEELIKDERTFVPVRFIGEALQCNVLWENDKICGILRIRRISYETGSAASSAA